MSARAQPGGRPAGGLFYGWVIVVALGVTITISYGTMSYSMGVDCAATLLIRRR